MVALNPFHQDYVERRALFYWWLQAALGVGTAAVAAALVFPVTAGGRGGGNGFGPVLHSKLLGPAGAAPANVLPRLACKSLGQGR